MDEEKKLYNSIKDYRNGLLDRIQLKIWGELADSPVSDMSDEEMAFEKGLIAAAKIVIGFKLRDN